jgi:hypothetical protein
MVLERATLSNLKQNAKVDVSFSEVVNALIYDPLCVAFFVSLCLAQVNVKLLLYISVVNEKALPIIIQWRE